MTTAIATLSNNAARKKKGRARRWVRRAIAGVFVVAAAVLLVMAWLPKPLPVETSHVARGAMRVTVDETSKTRLRDRYIISAPLAGDLLRVELRAGDPIEQGAVLARVVPTAPPLLDARSRLEAASRLAVSLAAQRRATTGKERATVAYEHAHNLADDARRLASTGAISDVSKRDAEVEERLRDQEVASARFSVQVADNEVELARSALKRVAPMAATEQLDVTAPARGVVLHVLRESGGVVLAGAPIVEIGDARVLEVVCDVLTSDAVAIRPGTKVTFERWGGEHPLEGHVRLIEPAAFTRISALGVEEQRASVVIDLDTPPEEWSALGDGYRLDAHIVVWEKSDALTAPSSAVFRAAGTWAVYVVKDGRARKTHVEVGRRNDAQVEILGGVADGDVVVVHPSDRLSDGSRVALL